jgi:hypothetical protein
LIPRKVKHIIAPLAEKHSLTPENTYEIIRTYWAYVREQMSSLEHDRILIPNLGTFYVKPWALNKKIESVNRYVDMLKPRVTIQSYAILKDKERELEKMLLMQDVLGDIKESKKAFKEKKKLI